MSAATEAEDAEGTPLAAADGTAAATPAGATPTQVAAPAHAQVQAHAKVQAAAGAEREFLSVLAHELNNAVMPLRFHAKALQGAQASLSPAQGASLQAIHKALERLASLAAETMESARIHSGRLRLAYGAFDLQETAREAHAAYLPMATAAGVRLLLEPHAPCPVIGDAQRLHQVIANLLSNALKATPRGGTIRLEARSRGDHALVRVADTGVGFSPAQAARLLRAPGPDAPSQGAAPGTGAGAGAGAGLGLYICRGFVEAHAGRIGCESPGPGRGATFWFTVPALPSGEPRLA